MSLISLTVDRNSNSHFLGMVINSWPFCDLTFAWWTFSMDLDQSHHAATVLMDERISFTLSKLSMMLSELFSDNIQSNLCQNIFQVVSCNPSRSLAMD